MNAGLVNARAERRTLKTYKDEEYPVKVLQIAEMKRDLDKLKEAQQVQPELDIIKETYIHSIAFSEVGLNG